MEHNVVYIGNDRCRLYVGSSRRCVVTESGGSILPEGYTQLEELSVQSGIHFVVTDIVRSSSSVVKWRFVFTAKYYSVANNLRQLNGWEQNPWFGCDKGKWKCGSTTTSITPANNTELTTDVWYDFDITLNVRPYTGSMYLFQCSGSNHNQYQSYMSYKGFQAYESDIIRGNFIPCKNPDNEEGLYNTVTGVFCKLN